MSQDKVSFFLHMCVSVCASVVSFLIPPNWFLSAHFDFVLERVAQLFWPCCKEQLQLVYFYCIVVRLQVAKKYAFNLRKLHVRQQLPKNFQVPHRHRAKRAKGAERLPAAD